MTYAILSLAAQIWVLGAVFTFITGLPELRISQKIYELRGNRWGGMFWVIAAVATFICWPYPLYERMRRY